MHAASRRTFIRGAAAALAALAVPALAQPSRLTIFRNVRIFDGTSASLLPATDVAVRGNVIDSVGARADPPADALVFDGSGRVLIPGLIDAHTHMTMSAVPLAVMMTADPNYILMRQAKAATDMLLRGFTSARDLGGPCFGMKRAIDEGFLVGPRIWPCGATISQTSGHGDFRAVHDLPRAAGDRLDFTERLGYTAIADGVPEVLRRVRENLMQGASHVKLMAGGGVASSFDPLDVTQYSEEEMRAAVGAAADWGTYVCVHAYTPKAVQRAIGAGARCIEHGQLADETTARMMADKGVWWSLQPFLDDADATPFPEGSPNRAKQLVMVKGTDTAYALARKYRIKTAFGTDTLFDATLATRQGAQLSKLTRWYPARDILRMGTADNAELLALSGARNPYPGKLGVVQRGALADLLLVDGDPLSNIGLIDDPDRNLLVIMKDGVVFKNKLADEPGG
jgi:imidazolonepropionase-like amidohydrolase